MLHGLGHLGHLHLQQAVDQVDVSDDHTKARPPWLPPPIFALAPCLSCAPVHRECVLDVVRALDKGSHMVLQV